MRLGPIVLLIAFGTVASDAGPLLPSGNDSNQLIVDIVQGVCKDSGEDVAVIGAEAKLSSTNGWSDRTGLNGLTRIFLPPNVRTGMGETIVVRRGGETLEVVLPRNGNIVIPNLKNSKPVKLVVQAKGSKSSLCSIEVQEPLTKRALASSLVQSQSSNDAVNITSSDLSRLAEEFKSPSFDQFPIGILALEIHEWPSAAEAFDSSLVYRNGKYHNKERSSQSSIAYAAYLSGYSHYQMKQYTLAADLFKQSDTHQPNMPQTLASYAISLGEAGQEADEAYLRALELASSNDDDASRQYKARLLQYFGGYLNNREKYGEAKQRLEQAVALCKDLPDHEAELAEDYIDLAYSLHEMPSGSDPINPQIENYLRLAVKLSSKAQPEKLAVAQYRLAAHLTEDYGEIDQSHFPEAEDLFRSACPRLPSKADDLDGPACRTSYAELLKSKGDCAGAKQELQSIMEKLDRIATEPHGRDIANKAGGILQECQ